MNTMAARYKAKRPPPLQTIEEDSMLTLDPITQHVAAIPLIMHLSTDPLAKKKHHIRQWCAIDFIITTYNNWLYSQFMDGYRLDRTAIIQRRKLAKILKFRQDVVWEDSEEADQAFHKMHEMMAEIMENPTWMNRLDLDLFKTI